MTPPLTGYWAKRRERGRCPLCRGLLLYASHEPHDEREWEQWHATIRKATRKEAITSVMDLGTPGEQAAYHLIHAYCRRRTGGRASTP
jgi:RNA-directed DNA polymerase